MVGTVAFIAFIGKDLLIIKYGCVCGLTLQHYLSMIWSEMTYTLQNGHMQLL